MPPRGQEANLNNQQEDQPNHQADQVNQQADQPNQHANQTNQNIQRLRELSANASTFNQILADFLITIHEQLTILTQKVSELNLQNLRSDVDRHEMILNGFYNSYDRNGEMNS